MPNLPTASGVEPIRLAVRDCPLDQGEPSRGLMSEYQYYEFQAIDRPLGEADRKALRELSSRARITASSFSNHYEWGNFKGDPKRLMESCFDLHLYLTNWGTRRLMIRLPGRLVEQARLDAFLHGIDWVEVWTAGGNLIVDIYREDVEPDTGEWDDGSGWLAALAPLRDAVLSGDLRLFYVLWLAAMEDGIIGEDSTEPLPGIGPMTGALEALGEFLGIDPDLVAAAAESHSGPDHSAMSEDAMRRALEALPEGEKNALLLRVATGDPHVATELRLRVREPGAAPAAGLRTVGELRARRAEIVEAWERAEAERREAERLQREARAEEERRARLDALRRRGDRAWQDVEAAIERRNEGGYAAALGLLSDLEELAADQGARADFASRVRAIRERHARKRNFVERLDSLAAGRGR